MHYSVPKRKREAENHQIIKEESKQRRKEQELQNNQKTILGNNR